MFANEVKPDNGFLSWLLQQIAALTVPVVWSLASSSLVGTLWQKMTEPLQILVGIALYFVVGWGLAFALAVGVHRRFPGAMPAGEWVWPLPLLVLVLVFSHDCTVFPISHVLSEFLYPGANGEAWWAFDLFTYPTLSCAVYSFGMWYVRPAPNEPSHGSV